ncbi:MAG TPA: CAP domain-containing protein [Anaerolineae bacterium]
MMITPSKVAWLLGPFVLVFVLVLGVWADELAPEAPQPEGDEPDLVSLDGLVPALYLPVVPSPPASWINTQDRAESQAFYLTQYRAFEGVDSGWTGHHGSCRRGATSTAFQDAVLRRINYFRAMAGIPPVSGFIDEYNRKAQEAALMMSVNNQLSHSPDSSWHCYTEDGREAAGSSNLAGGIDGAGAMSLYMDDGSGNNPVGHRRWILYPQTQFMGTGDVPARDGHWASNALWVFDRDNMWRPRPDTREPFVAWPPPGYVPYQVVYPLWSFAYAGADFSGVAVTMTRDGAPVTIQVSDIVNGFGENTLVWEPDGYNNVAPGADVHYTIQVKNVLLNGVAHNFAYEVIVFDPGG